MKTIKTLIEIPAKYKWMAQDENGKFYAYELRPRIRLDYADGGTWDTGDYRYIGLGEGNPNPDWKNTLCRIEEYEDVTEEL